MQLFVIPGSNSGSRMLDDMAIRIEIRPFVQILLVAHLAVFQAIVAPFDTLLAPARKAAHPLFIAPETHPFNTETAVNLAVLQPWGKAVFNNRDGTTAY